MLSVAVGLLEETPRLCTCCLLLWVFSRKHRHCSRVKVERGLWQATGADESGLPVRGEYPAGGTLHIHI